MIKWQKTSSDRLIDTIKHDFFCRLMKAGDETKRSIKWNQIDCIKNQPKCFATKSLFQEISQASHFSSTRRQARLGPAPVGSIISRQLIFTTKPINPKFC